MEDCGISESMFFVHLAKRDPLVLGVVQSLLQSMSKTELDQLLAIQGDLFTMLAAADLEPTQREQARFQLVRLVETVSRSKENLQ